MALGKQAKILTDKQVRAVLAELDTRRYPLRDRVMFLLSIKSRNARQGSRLGHLGDGHRCRGRNRRCDRPGEQSLEGQRRRSPYSRSTPTSKPR